MYVYRRVILGVLVAKMGRIVDVWLMIIRGLYYPIDSIDPEEYHDGIMG